MQNLRLAFRTLRATPILSTVAVLSLALGIGANTAIFSILNSLLLKPLPVRDAHRLVGLASAPSQDDVRVNYPAWKQIQDRRLLDEAFAWAMDSVSMADAGSTTPLQAIWASGDFFDSLGVPTILGRTFGKGDDRRGGGSDGPVAVISYGLWQRKFGGASDAIGRTITLDHVPFTIAGVAPRSFFGLDVGTAIDVVLPLETEPLMGRVPPRLDTTLSQWLRVVGRLPREGTVDAVTGALRRAQPGIRETTMPGYTRAEDRDAYLRAPWVATGAGTGSSRLRSRYRPALFALLAITGLVLLVACANVANLQLARIAGRRYELGLRRALGASRLRLVRQLFAESLLLSAAGAALGLAFAQWGSRLLVEQLSSTAFLDLSPDWRVLGLTGAITVATAVLFGTGPARRASRVEPIETLKQQSRGIAGEQRQGLASGLVVVQVALSLLLLVGAGLFLRSFAALAYRDLGFDRGRVLVAVVDARRSAIPPSGRSALYERVREAVRAVAGVESAATSMATPMGSAGVRLEREVAVLAHGTAPARQGRISVTPVGPDWFKTFGTRLTAGRDFDARDRLGALNVAIVNEAFVRRYLREARPIGLSMTMESNAADRRPVEIVGVVQDAAFTSVRDPVEPTVYRPFAQEADDEMLAAAAVSVSVRTAQGGSPAQLTRGIAAAIGGVDRTLSVSFQSVSDQLSVFYVRERLLALLSGFFGAVALLLAALGLYGVTAHSVSRRRREIGIRMALGATAAGVIRLVLSRVSMLVGAGIIVGAGVSLWLSTFVATLLYGLEPRDPLTLVGSAAVLAIVAGLAGGLPAWRASRVDPAEVLRES